MFDGIDPKVLGAVRALAREVRYRVLPSIVGRRVRIEHVDDIDRAVRAAVPEIPADATLSGGHTREIALAKYGLADLEYEVRFIDAPPIGVRGLRSLGLLDREPDEMPDALASSHEELFAWLDECRQRSPLLKLFMQGPPRRDVVPGRTERELTIIDACETTGGFVWLLKHFYL